MEGLFAVIFVIIGIVNFVMKQQQEQSKHQGGMKRQPKPHLPGNDTKSIQDFWNETMHGMAESEGIEAEDRSRVGSLEYIEQSKSLEGECDEHPEHRQKQKKKGKQAAKPAPAAVIPETEEEGITIELTEEHLLSSFIMSEIIGPPRALKRSIR